MSSIVLTGLEDTSDTTLYKYKDVRLDIQENSNISDHGLYRESNTTDITESRDFEAVSNSIFNIFNTTPGQKILSPTFGLDLKRYLFSPLTTDIAENIGETILLGLERWEPRVRIINVHVLVDIILYQYEITLTIAIPSLNIENALLKGVLTKNGYSTTSRAVNLQILILIKELTSPSTRHHYEN